MLLLLLDLIAYRFNWKIIEYVKNHISFDVTDEREFTLELQFTNGRHISEALCVTSIAIQLKYKWFL